MADPYGVGRIGTYQRSVGLHNDDEEKNISPLVALNFHQPQVAENYSYLFNLRSKMEMLMLKDKLHPQQQGFNYLLIKWILNLSPHDALKHHFTSLKNELITYT